MAKVPCATAKPHGVVALFPRNGSELNEFSFGIYILALELAYNAIAESGSTGGTLPFAPPGHW